MDNAGYATLTRQSGLMREIRILANNMANANTTGYREEGVLFSEFIRRAGEDGSVSMTTARIARTILDQGPLRPTAGTFDVAIDGDGFFVVQTDAGERLTRAGSFTPDAQGDLVTPDGNRVLDAGGAPIFIPPDAGAVAIAGDGTISAAGRLLGQIGVVVPTDPLGLSAAAATPPAISTRPVLVPVGGLALRGVVLDVRRRLVRRRRRGIGLGVGRPVAVVRPRGGVMLIRLG